VRNGVPKRLRAGANIAFIGSYVLGKGFVLTPDEAAQFLDDDPKNADVLFPYLDGDDLKSVPEQRPTRWVVSFWDWPQDRARKYKLPWRRVEETVKEERQGNNRKGYRDYWWHFAEKRPAMYHAIGRGRHFEQHPEGLAHRRSDTRTRARRRARRKVLQPFRRRERRHLP
jgi:hypothetical protein